MNKNQAMLIAAGIFISLPCFAGKEKQEWQSPFSGTTSSKALNARLDSTKKYSAIPIISTKQFFTDYTANEAAADLKYKDKPIIIIGYVSRISKDFMDETHLSFWGDQYGFKSIDAQLFPEQICGKEGNYSVCSSVQRAAILEKKDKVKLECFGGTMAIQTPQATRCLLAPH